jgi:hypothetical protein
MFIFQYLLTSCPQKQYLCHFVQIDLSLDVSILQSFSLKTLTPFGD